MINILGHVTGTCRVNLPEIIGVMDLSMESTYGENMHAIPCILSTRCSLDYCNSLPSASSADVRARESDDVTSIRSHTYTAM